jgi:hypothetical protein
MSPAPRPWELRARSRLDFTRARNLLLSELASVSVFPARHTSPGSSSATPPPPADIDLAAVREVRIEDLTAAAAAIFAAPPTLSLVGPLNGVDYLATVKAALA